MLPRVGRQPRRQRDSRDGGKSESMTTRLALTPAVGLFTGLSMVSFGAVSMFLTGVHGSGVQATNACSASSSSMQASTGTGAGTTHMGAMYIGGAHAYAPTNAPAVRSPSALHAPSAAHVISAH